MQSASARCKAIRSCAVKAIRGAIELYNLPHNSFNNLQLACDDLIAPNNTIGNDLSWVNDELYEKYFDWFMVECIKDGNLTFSHCKTLMNTKYAKLYGPKIFCKTFRDFETFITNNLPSNHHSVNVVPNADIVKFSVAKVCDTPFPCINT